jgi:transposase-like protein
MKHYSPERKEAVIQKMMPSINMSISALSSERGITQTALYNRRKHVNNRGVAVAGYGKNAEQWSLSNKFAIAI